MTCGARVVIQTICRERDLGVLYSSIPNLAEQLHDQPRLDQLRASVSRQRDQFMFDTHVDALVAFFRQVLKRRVPYSVSIAAYRQGKDLLATR